MDTSKFHPVQAGILFFPDPISTPWDAQFNYLLEQRGKKITEELGRLEAARRESIGRARGGQANAGEALAAFIAASEFIDDEAERKIRED